MKKKVFLLGDSISIQYGPYLELFIEGEYEYHRKRGWEENVFYSNIPIGENGGDSNQVLCFLKELKISGRRFDILLINCGLHDVKRDRETNEINTNKKSYEENLQKIVDVGELISNKIFWIETTMVDEEVHSKRGFGPIRFNEDIEEYNEIASRVMSNNNIRIIKFNKIIKKQFDKIHWDHMHFVDEIRVKQAEIIADYLFALKTLV